MDNILRLHQTTAFHYAQSSMFDKASKCCPSCKEDFPRNPGGRCQKTKIKNSIPEKSSQLITYLPHQTVVMVNYTESPILSPFAR